MHKRRLKFEKEMQQKANELLKFFRVPCSIKGVETARKRRNLFIQ